MGGDPRQLLTLQRLLPSTSQLYFAIIENGFHLAVYNVHAL